MAAETETDVERRERVQAKIEEAFKGISEALTKRGREIDDVARGDGYLVFNRVDEVLVPVEIREEHPSNRWTTTPRGRIRIKVGSYGDKVQFPERKKGFDFAAIADAIEKQFQSQKGSASRRKEDSRKLDELNASMARVIESGGPLPPSARCVVDPHLNGINITVEALTEEQALRAVLALQEILSKISAVDRRRLRDGRRALRLLHERPKTAEERDLQLAELHDAIRAMQSLDDLGTEAANKVAWADMEQLMKHSEFLAGMKF